jgi:hypothetical protein
MGWFSKLVGRKPSYEVSPVYLDLRSQVLNLANEGLPGGVETQGPLAVVMDVGGEDHCYTFVAVADGATSLYFSNGGGVIGAGENPKVGAAAREFVAASASVAPALSAATEFPLPEAGQVALHLVTREAVLQTREAEDDLGEGRSRLSAWFHEIHRLIAMIRHVTELRKTESPLVFAAAMDLEEEAQEQLAKGADPNSRSSQGQPVLGVACTAGAVAVAKLLLEAGGKVDVAMPFESGKQMPLVCAVAAADQAEALALLLDAGGDIEAKESSGLTPLHLACYLGNVEAATLLIDRGAALEAREEAGYTPLMMAANGGQQQTAELLLSRGAEANAEDNDRSTPIMFAAQHGHLGIVKALLAAKADPRRKGDHGLNALDFAAQNGHDEVGILMMGN